MTDDPYDYSDDYQTNTTLESLNDALHRQITSYDSGAPASRAARGIPGRFHSVRPAIVDTFELRPDDKVKMRPTSTG